MVETKKRGSQGWRRSSETDSCRTLPGHSLVCIYHIINFYFLFFTFELTLTRGTQLGHLWAAIETIDIVVPCIYLYYLTRVFMNKLGLDSRISLID